MKFYLLTSIIINLFLVLALFFKEALNKLLFHKFELNEQKEKEKTEILKRLRILLMEYVPTSIHFIDRCVDCWDEKFKLGNTHYKEMKEKYDKICLEIRRLTPDIEKDLRDELQTLMKNIILMETDIILKKDLVGMERLKAKLKIAQSCVDFILLSSTFITKIEDKVVK